MATKAEDEPERKMSRQITSLDDDELWAGFEWEGVDRILSGEIKPRTLITTYDVPNRPHRERGPLIAKEMLSVFPNSRYMRRGFYSQMHEVIGFAKKRGCTSLILAYTEQYCGHDTIVIISLLNGAAATFKVLNLTPLEDVPNHADPTSRCLYPHLHMVGFKSPASVGTARMIQSLFPKVPLSRKRSVAWCQNQNNVIFFRPFRFCSEEAVAGESPSVGRQKQMCGPQFALKLINVHKVSFDTGDFERMWKPVEQRW